MSKRGCTDFRHSLFTFQLFMYESLSIWYHYLIKRTRDVSNCPFLLFVIITMKNSILISGIS